jgi:hypothetical protein
VAGRPAATLVHSGHGEADRTGATLLSRCVPTGHTAHGTVSSLASSYRCPSGQAVQSPSAPANILSGHAHSAEPSGDFRPPVQASHTQRPGDGAAVSAAHAVQGVAAIRSASTCPARHSTQAVDPSAANVPTGQMVHSSASSAADAVPAGQVWHRPFSSFLVPAGHVEEQHTECGSSPIVVLLLKPESSEEPAGHTFSFPHSAHVAPQHGAERCSYPAGHAGLEPH